MAADAEVAEEPFTVEKTAEGVHFEEQQLPIDINYAKLADWLVDRRKVPADWRKRIASIQARVNKLLPELPRGQHPELLSIPTHSEGCSVGYLETKRVRDVLVEAHPEERTIFGGHSGISGSWDSVLRAYDSNFVFLGEAATILVQNANYEIPFFCKQASKAQQQLADLDRKEGEYRKAAAASTRSFQAACKELGIQGKDIKTELKALVQELPGLFQRVVDTVASSKDIETAVEYYRQFLAHVHRQQGSEYAVLPMLVALREDPSSATVSAQTSDPSFATNNTEASALLSPGDPPTAMAAAAQALTLLPSSEDSSPIPVEQAQEITIDWGVVSSEAGGAGSLDAEITLCMPGVEGPVAEAAGAPAIQWDFDTSAAGETPPSGRNASDGGLASAGPQIVWDFAVGEAEEGRGTVGEGQEEGGVAGEAPAIQWGVDTSAGDGIVSVSDAGPQIVWDFAVEEAGEERSSGGEGQEEERGAGVSPLGEGMGLAASLAAPGPRPGAQEAAVLSVARHRLSQQDYRNMLLDDLFELRAFLRERASEMVREEGSPLQTQLLAAAPHGPLQELSAASLSSLEQAVRELVGMLTCRRTTDLLLIYTSPRYVDRLEESLKQRKGNEARLLGSMESLHRKRQELRTSLSAALIKQEETVRRTRAVKELVEKTLSAQYSGRPVNIIGEINNQLGPAA